jgi:hypothetical protein
VRPGPGAWEGFAEASIGDWIEILGTAQPGVPLPRAEIVATRTLALLRGRLLDLLARDQPALLGRALRSTAGKHRLETIILP